VGDRVIANPFGEAVVLRARGPTGDPAQVRGRREVLFVFVRHGPCVGWGGRYVAGRAGPASEGIRFSPLALCVWPAQVVEVAFTRFRAKGYMRRDQLKPL
jgi:hypothetical protein